MSATGDRTFADLLTDLRANAGLTQEELAERAGMSSQAVSALERGVRRRPRRDTVHMLAGALELDDATRIAFEAAARSWREPATRQEDVPGPNGGTSAERIDRVLPEPASASPREALPPSRGHLARRLPSVPRRTVLFATALLALIVIAPLAAVATLSRDPAAWTPLDPRPVAVWGTLSDAATPFQNPSGLALDGDGNLYVADAGADQIYKLSRSGRLIARYGRRGAGPGEFRKPHGVALAPDGSIYVADTGNARVVKLSPAGTFVRAWGSWGDGPGRFEMPFGVAVDAENTLYISDYDTSSIQTLSPDGSFQVMMNGNAGLPADIGLDPAGNLYVAEAGASTIQVFSPGGGLQADWPSVGRPPDTIRWMFPSGVAVDRAGHIAVADMVNRQVVEFFSDGTVVQRWGGSSQGAPIFRRPRTVAIGPDGAVYVADGEAHQILKLSPNGRVIARWTGAAPRPHLDRPIALALGRSGTVYVASAGENAVYELGRDGGLLDTFRPLPAAASLRGIAVNTQGVAYIASSGDLGVRAYTVDRRGLIHGSLSPRSVGRWLSGEGENRPRLFDHPTGLAVDATGNLFVADSYNGRAVELRRGDLKGFWPVGPPSRRASESGVPTVSAVTVDGQGDLYITDITDDRVYRLAPGGQEVAQWGGTGSGPGQLSLPEGIAVDSRHHVYVADTYNNRIDVFSDRGDLLGSWGSPGSGPGQFNHPYAVAVDARGDVYVADTDNNRVQVFAPHR